MGLLDKLFGSTQPAKKPTDDVLLLHAMLVMAGADGVIEQSEVASVQAFLQTLPEFREKDDLQATFDQARKLVSRHGGVRESIKALADLQNPAVRAKAFVLAVDIAMASGDIDEEEDKVLDAMQRVLNIDDETARNVIQVLGMKYAR